MKQFNVVRTIRQTRQYLAHQGHSHYWTTDRSLAMVYTKEDVAQGLASMYHGEVYPL